MKNHADGDDIIHDNKTVRTIREKKITITETVI